MKKSLLLLLDVFLSTCVAYAQVQMEKFKPKQLERVEPTKPEKLKIPTIEVLSPNGGETWETGKRYTIRWKSKGVKGNVKIMLKL